jgi:hypothetical protein
MKELLTSLHLAKKQIKETKLEKKGHNSYSNYYYFLPEQIEQLVFDACDKNGLYTKFDLVRGGIGEEGERGILTVFHIDTMQSISFEMATAIPEIKATNIAQQLGGCATYTERYLKQTAFGIAENTLDFDAPKKEATPTKEAPKKPWLNLGSEDWKKVEASIKAGAVKDIKIVKDFYSVNKEVEAKLKELLS